MSDIFQEVEEDVRHERYKALWKKYGNYVIGATALLVLGVAGFQLWQVWDRSRHQAASDSFHAAEQLAEAGHPADAEAAFAKLADSAPGGYATLAKFHQAAALMEEGRRDEALALYRSLADQHDPLLAGAARIRIAWALAEYAPREEIEKTLAPLTDANNPWRFSAQEVLAYVELRTGTRAAAVAAYARLAADPKAPPGVRARAGAVAQYLNANPDFAPAAPETAPQ